MREWSFSRPRKNVLKGSNTLTSNGRSLSVVCGVKVTIPIFHNMNVHVTSSIVHDKKNLVLYQRTRLLMKRLQCLHKAFTVHPAIRMQYALGTEDHVPHESWVLSASGNYKHERDGLPHRICNTHKCHGVLSFLSYLHGYWLTPHTHNFTRLQNCGQRTLIQILYPDRSEFILPHS